ncbi:peptidyl-tRNA hydrolase ICT1, mitochondrial [Cimex lectularius]|uniref:Large ribosomal subunit protein mL62 n=1 Tax=Cimex lectularius TaxID=79782 RepID=D1FPL5_CIMLE|nr:peptidyl-tRNA hydrolase ICT1, mitochondrial [Cimex lectularius]
MAAYRLRPLLTALPNTRNLSLYKSNISLSNLYPKSSLNFTTPVSIPDNGSAFSGFIPVDKVDITYSRSSGPGGQHVNTVNTKVDVRFHVESAEWLSDDVKKRILENLKNKINKDGYLVVRSDKTRSQIYNQADAMMILRRLIHSALVTKPAITQETLEVLRKRKEKANQERLMKKRMHSLKKKDRQDNF